MRQRDPQPDARAARALARLLGPALLLVLLAAWALAWIGPPRDAARLSAEREAGLAALPPAPAPSAQQGIDGRSLDPRDRERGSPSDGPMLPAPSPPGPAPHHPQAPAPPPGGRKTR
jgi:hypothetical protein